MVFLEVIFQHNPDGDGDKLYYLRCDSTGSLLRSGRDSQAVLFSLGCSSCPRGLF